MRNRMLRWLFGFIGCCCLTLLATPVVHPARTLGPAAIGAGSVSEQPEEPSEPTTTTFTIALTGDVLLHNTVWPSARTSRGYDFTPLLAPISPTISGADLAICHLETPVSAPGGPYQSFPLFSVPPQITQALVNTGYDACTTASNHSVDQGFSGVVQTTRALDRVGLAHTGTAATPAASREVLLLPVNDLQVAVLSYTYGTNGMPIEKPWSINLINPRAIKADAAKARNAGADAVLVALHWGTEYVNAPTSEQIRVARSLAKSKAIDLIYGHHAHVVQPVGQIRGKPVIWGLGNLIADQATVADGVDRGMIALARFSQVAGRITVDKIQIRPTLIDSSAHRGSMRVLDVRRELKRRPGDPAWRELLRSVALDVRRIAAGDTTR